MAWNLKIVDKNNHAIRFKIEEAGTLLSFRQVFEYWQMNPEFIRFYAAALQNVGYPAFFWEHPALRLEYLSLPYEVVLQKSNSFANRQVNEQAFKDYIHSTSLVAVFDNLGKNARLVVPTKHGEATIYKHFARFLRDADAKQIQVFFRQIGITILEEIADNDYIWLNTEGLGVLWLHIRMDTRPKYYHTKTYKSVDFLKKLAT